MPQLPRFDSASAGSGFSWKPWMRPSSSTITTPNWLGSSTRFSASVAMPPFSLCVFQSAVRSMSVSASPEMTRNVSSPKWSRTLRTPPAVPSSSGSNEYASRTP